MIFDRLIYMRIQASAVVCMEHTIFLPRVPVLPNDHIPENDVIYKQVIVREIKTITTLRTWEICNFIFSI
jgi:hypothetical protein